MSSYRIVEETSITGCITYKIQRRNYSFFGKPTEDWEYVMHEYSSLDTAKVVLERFINGPPQKVVFER